jgi:hypothetical protein
VEQPEAPYGSGFKSIDEARPAGIRGAGRAAATPVSRMHHRAGRPSRETAPSDERTGVFTSNILAITAAHHKIALYFTGSKHAGEMADVLKQRCKESPPPIQMCDALSRNTPKASGVDILLANCMAHGRRQFVEIAPNFPAECLNSPQSAIISPCPQYEISQMRLPSHEVPDN